jgi:hypothetical protein
VAKAQQTTTTPSYGAKAQQTGKTSSYGAASQRAISTASYGTAGNTGISLKRLLDNKIAMLEGKSEQYGEPDFVTRFKREGLWKVCMVKSFTQLCD